MIYNFCKTTCHGNPKYYLKDCNVTLHCPAYGNFWEIVCFWSLYKTTCCFHWITVAFFFRVVKSMEGTEDHFGNMQVLFQMVDLVSRGLQVCVAHTIVLWQHKLHGLCVRMTACRVYLNWTCAERMIVHSYLLHTMFGKTIFWKFKNV
jgi:hypothetical protein